MGQKGWKRVDKGVDRAVTPEEWDLWRIDGYKSFAEKSFLQPFVGKKKINIGCGYNQEPIWTGWINSDYHFETNANLLFDITKSWPFKDETFDTICAQYVFHLFHGKELFDAIYNSGKSLKIGGYLIGKVPYGATGNPMQTSFWSEHTPSLFDRRVYQLGQQYDMVGWQGRMPMVNWEVSMVDLRSDMVFVIKRVQ